MSSTSCSRDRPQREELAGLLPGLVGEVPRGSLVLDDQGLSPNHGRRRYKGGLARLDVFCGRSATSSPKGCGTIRVWLNHAVVQTLVAVWGARAALALSLEWAWPETSMRGCSRG